MVGESVAAGKGSCSFAGLPFRRLNLRSNTTNKLKYSHFISWKNNNFCKKRLVK